MIVEQYTSDRGATIRIHDDFIIEDSKEIEEIIARVSRIAVSGEQKGN